MKIAICDDELAQGEYLKSLAKKWADNNSHTISIELFSNADAFRFAMGPADPFDVLLLDIQMPGQSGMELAKALRQKGEALSIVFITGYSDYMGEGYEVSALNYLLKPVKEEKLFTCLDKAFIKAQEDVGTLLIQCGGDNLRIRQDEIIYVEAFAHSVVLVTLKERYECGEMMGALERHLDKGLFFRPHRSYIVGLKYVRKITKSDMLMDNSAVIPVSRQRYSDANKAFIQYYRGKNE